MPKNYQRVKDNPYVLPNNLYMRVVYIVKDYERLKDEYDVAVGYSTPAVNGMPRSQEMNRVTEGKALLIATMFDELYAITEALDVMPREFRDGVFKKLVKGDPWSITTTQTKEMWQRYESIYLYGIAQKLNLI